MIKLEVTYEQTKALALLGIESAVKALENHDIAERRLRHHLSAMSRSIRYIEKNGLDTDGIAMKLFGDTEEKARALATHKKVRLMFGQYNEQFLEECASISHRCEFIINHKDSKETMEGYFELYVTNIAKSLEWIWNEVELEFGD